RGYVSGSGRSELAVDVLEADAASDHHDLDVVEQLGDLQGGGVLALVLGCHPHLGRLLDDLLADRMDAGVQLGDGPGVLGPRVRLVLELGIQVVEGLHAPQDRPPLRRTRDGVHAQPSVRTASAASTSPSSRPCSAMKVTIASQRAGSLVPVALPYSGTVASTVAIAASRAAGSARPGTCSAATSTAPAGSSATALTPRMVASTTAAVAAPSAMSSWAPIPIPTSGTSPSGIVRTSTPACANRTASLLAKPMTASTWPALSAACWV